MKTITSVTFFHDAVGMRASVTYSEIDDQGKIVADNKRIDVVVVDAAAKKKAQGCLDWAQEVVNGIE